MDKVKLLDGVSIAYRVTGKGKPALVFVHGWCCDQSYWDAQVPCFTRMYTVVTLDLAGHGESGLDRKAWTMPAFGEDVVAVCHDGRPRRVQPSSRRSHQRTCLVERI